ncbi:GTP cyclohydrolase I [Ewingella americana]|uniref:GTP cyclohydrolase I n=1 Tax=Ewingella americana TaxID=41202 RepID=A0A502GFC0_9GAMM|nr:GTP cyclohydrolase I [Ewingella americana]TPG59980.1 GTP cyclohydrolase I [Ewingella americana]
MDNTNQVTQISQVIRERIIAAQTEWDVKTQSVRDQLQTLSNKLEKFEKELGSNVRRPELEFANSSSAVEHGNSLTARIVELKSELSLMGDRPRFHAADNISAYIHSEEEMQGLQDDVAKGFAQVLNALVIDTENDHNTRETNKRVAKMYIREVFSGRYLPEPKITEFPNDRNLDEVIIIGPFRVRSACSHHFVPIIGSLWIGIKPGKSVAGLSKYGRLAEWILSRPHIQEEAIQMLADELDKLIEPQGLIVSISAKHMCMSWRGIKDEAATTTSVVRGEFRKNASMKSEFFEQVRVMQNDPALR